LDLERGYQSHFSTLLQMLFVVTNVRYTLHLRCCYILREVDIEILETVYTVIITL